MKAIDHPLGMGQQDGTGLVVRRPHIHAVGSHLFPLRGGQLLQAFPSGRFIPACLDSQNLRLLRLRQIRQDRDIQLVALFQADLVHPHARNDSGRIDGLDLSQLLPDNASHGLGRNA